MPECETRDGGSYLLLLRLDRPKRVRVGRLGLIAFARGHHVYVGSAVRHLSARIAWHQRADKKPRWHVDYLRRRADAFLALPIPSSRRDECRLARALAGILEAGPRGFGSSDCRCATHLFRSRRDPLRLPSFHAALRPFRPNGLG